MAVPLTILTDPRDPAPRRTLSLPPATSILRGAHAAGSDITATGGGRGRCTSCRVKFVTGTVPPPTIMDEIQLGDDQVREGYRLSCQCMPSEAVTVQVAPPLEERAFQILGAGPGVVGMGRVTLDSGIRKQDVKVGLPREEHHQTSDLEQLAAGLGVTPADVGLAVVQGLPGALRDDPAGVTVTTFAAAGGERVIAVERGDTAGMKFGLAVDIGTTSVVSTLIELESGEQLGSVSSLNPQAVFGGDLMSRIAFAQFHPGNLRKLHTRIVGLLNQHIEEICRQSGVLAKWIYKVVVVGNTCMHHLLLGIDPSYVGLAPYAPVMRHPLVLPARELFLKVAPEARVCLLPLVAGFVGADAVAVALATRIYESAEIRIAVDIGTNGEVLLGWRARGDRPQPGRRAAGPAREGGDRIRRRDAPARRGRARREGGRADARGRLRQLRLDRERAPHRADPAPSGGADPLRRQRGGARRPALPRLGDRAPARGERGGAHRARLARRPPDPPSRDPPAAAGGGQAPDARTTAHGSAEPERHARRHPVLDRGSERSARHDDRLRVGLPRRHHRWQGERRRPALGAARAARRRRDPLERGRPVGDTGRPRLLRVRADLESDPHGHRRRPRGGPPRPAPRRSFAEVTQDLIEEALRMRQCPGIYFADEILGREAKIGGTGLGVWEVTQGYQAVKGNEKKLHKALPHVGPAGLKSALLYYRQYPGEIDEAIAENALTFEALEVKYPGLARRA